MRTILVIPDIKYERNFYNAVRSAEAFGITEVCTSSKTKVSKLFPAGSMGTWKHIKINKFNTDEDMINYLIKEGIYIVCIENSKDSQLVSNFKFKPKMAFVMGHENLGVPEKFKESFKSIKIPQFGSVNCLNTYVAMSIVLYERFKQALKI